MTLLKLYMKYLTSVASKLSWCEHGSGIARSRVQTPLKSCMITSGFSTQLKKLRPKNLERHLFYRDVDTYVNKFTFALFTFWMILNEITVAEINL